MIRPLLFMKIHGAHRPVTCCSEACTGDRSLCCVTVFRDNRPPAVFRRGRFVHVPSLSRDIRNGPHLLGTWGFCFPFPCGLASDKRGRFPVSLLRCRTHLRTDPVPTVNSRNHPISAHYPLYPISYFLLFLLPLLPQFLPRLIRGTGSNSSVRDNI